MCIIETVRREHEDLARTLKNHAGIRKIVEGLYPDNAHFIYELLQNAEDALATSAWFTLTETGLAFEHDGRPFAPRDIEAITDIGEGTKAGDDAKIGRFGVGFKAVFAYSETPHIWSPTFSFDVRELVLPYRLDSRPELGKNTRFEFPFNNPKKDPSSAFTEIEAGLIGLAKTTLLFLARLESIHWKIGDEASGTVRRIQHPDHHFEVLKQTNGETVASSHFLKFERPIAGLETQRAVVAFALDLLPKFERFDENTPLAEQMKIVPASPGQVSVFFPAEKETSGLRFHLHAPFVPELSRASIKESPANRPLFKQLASLAAESLHPIRDLGLLNADFLAVLPNPQDPLPDRYGCIRDSIIGAMKSEPLTPTHAKRHAPARLLLQAKASLKELLTPEDLEFLVEHESEPYQWAIAAEQKNSNADRFLAGLEIKPWGIKEFVELIKKEAGYRVDAKFMDWLSEQSLEWHQRLYALLLDETSEYYGLSQNWKIVRLADGEYGEGRTSRFPSEDGDQDDGLPVVDRAVYSSGKSKQQQEDARKFLVKLGVREIEEADRIGAILKQRYQRENFSPRKEDLRRFVVFVGNDLQRARMFADYLIFEGDDGEWHKPADIYLDRPFMDTGLAAYYSAVGDRVRRYGLAEMYHHCEVSPEKLTKFAEAVGARTRLEPTKVECSGNPEWSRLKSADGKRRSCNSINRDHTIEGIEILMANPSIEISKLIWNTMVSSQSRPEFLKAQYQKNSGSETRQADSQLVHHLRDSAWVPQLDGRFVRPAEADCALLPSGFPYDAGWAWLKAIGFGQEKAKRLEAEGREFAQKFKAIYERGMQAEELGFKNVENMDRALRFAKFSVDEQERLLAELEERRNFKLPEDEPADPERRARIVGEQAGDAPPKSFEDRTRSVAVGTSEVRESAKQYLQHQYTNSDGEMICQVCQEKARLPFTLDNGRYYFEKVEFLRKLQKRHYQNYLALCPNHAAMFEHANGSKDELMEAFQTIADNKLGVVLAGEALTIYFTGTHIADLKAVIEGQLDGPEVELEKGVALAMAR